MLHIITEVIYTTKHYGPLLRFLHSSVDREINAALEKMELTSAQGRILGFTLGQKTPPCPKDIEEAFHLSHPTVSGLLARMEKKGFIELKTDENDRRCKRIYILPKGEDCSNSLHQTILATEEKLVKGFTEEEERQFRSLLERTVTNMGAWPCKPKEEESK